MLYWITLVKAPVSVPAVQIGSSQQSASSSRPSFPEDSIKIIMDLGSSRPEAISLLEACNGNAEMAANMLFQG